MNKTIEITKTGVIYLGSEATGFKIGSIDRKQSWSYEKFLKITKYEAEEEMVISQSWGFEKLEIKGYLAYINIPFSKDSDKIFVIKTLNFDDLREKIIELLTNMGYTKGFIE